MKVTGIPNIMQNFIHFHLKTHVLVTEQITICYYNLQNYTDVYSGIIKLIKSLCPFIEFHNNPGNPLCPKPA